MISTIQKTEAARRAKVFAKASYARRIGPPLSRWRPGFVVIFHVGRSGSSVLGGMLRRHPRIFWAGEVFRTHLEKNEIPEETFLPSQLVGIPRPDIHELCQQSGPLYYGMEVKFFHLDLFDISVEDYLRYLVDVGMTHLVILERRNYLAKVVSSVRAHHDGRYHVRQGDEAPPESPLVDLSGEVAIDYSRASLQDHLVGYSQGFSQLRSAAANLAITPLEISYEDDISNDPSIAYKAVCHHVGVKPRGTSPGLRQIRQTELSSQIANLSDVQLQLAGTEFEWMLSD